MLRHLSSSKSGSIHLTRPVQVPVPPGLNWEGTVIIAYILGVHKGLHQSDRLHISDYVRWAAQTNKVLIDNGINTQVNAHEVRAVIERLARLRVFKLEQ